MPYATLPRFSYVTLRLLMPLLLMLMLFADDVCPADTLLPAIFVSMLSPCCFFAADVFFADTPPMLYFAASAIR